MNLLRKEVTNKINLSLGGTKNLEVQTQQDQGEMEWQHQH